MENLLYNISQVLGITIIHSVWQGLIVYFALRLVFLSLPALSAVKKYSLSVIALSGIALWFTYTFCVEVQLYDWSPAKTEQLSGFLTGLNLHAQPHTGVKETLYSSFKSYLPYVSVLYCMGLVINLCKLGMAWNRIRLVKKSMIIAENLQQLIDAFCKQLSIRKKVKVSFSRLVDVPCVIGYFKPILLLPITLTFQLSAAEIETILLHELSHIKANDYLVNLIQQIVSVVLFFNPFAQLISRIISTERENRCDDIVVKNTTNPLIYAYALLKLEEARQGELKLALAATQNKNHLLTRIERIMNTKKPIGNIRILVIAVIIFAGSLSSIAWLNPEIKDGKIAFKNIASKAKPAPVAYVAAAPQPVSIAPRHKAKPVFSLAPDTIRHAGVTDTNKKKKIKIVVEDENGNKKEYTSVNEMPESVRDDFYKDNLNNDLKMKMDFKMDSNFMKVDKFYKSEKWQNQVNDMQRQALAMARKMNTTQFKKQVEQMKRQAAEMEKKANSPEFKKRIEDMQKKGEDMQKKGEEMEKYMNSPEHKKQLEDLEKQGADMAKFYDSPEWKKQVDDIAKAGEEFGRQFVNNPEWKKMQAEILKQSDELAKAAANMNMDYKFDLKKDGDDYKAKPKKTQKIEKYKKVPEKKEQKEKEEKKEEPEN